MFKAPELTLPPQNPEAEQAVLGALLIGKDAIVEVMDILSPQDFYLEKHENIYKAMLDLFNAQKSIDLVTLTNKLKQGKILSKVGGISYLSELLNVVPTASHVESYAKVVQEKAIRRELIHSAYRQLEIAQDESVKDPVTEAGKSFMEVEKRSGISVKSPDYINKDYLKLMQQRKEVSGVTGITCGIEGVDRITKGFQPGNLVVIAAGTSQGKSAFALQIALNAVMDDKQVLFFTIEMTDIEVTDRLMAQYFKTPLDKIQKGDIKELEDKIDEVKSFPLFVVDDFVTSEDVRRYAYAYQKRYGVDLIVFDYLQIAGDHVSESEVKRVTDISRNLKKIAADMKIPVIALSQFSRDWEKQNRYPSMADLRWSGSIAQDANVVIILHREKADPSNPNSKDLSDDTTLWIEKNRQGALGAADLLFLPETLEFKEVEKL